MMGSELSPASGSPRPNLGSTQNLPTDLRAYFSGDWLVQRVIPGVTTMHGVCTFTPLGADLFQSEELAYQIQASGPLEGQSWYVWQFLPDGAVQTYRSNRAGEKQLPFLRLSFSASEQGPTAHDTHLCDPDSYRACFRIIDDQSFQVTYEVSGPRKGYTSVATYRRAAEARPR